MAADPDWSRNEDLYAVLGVTPDATDKEIRDAYRVVARASHPDRRPDDRAAEDRFKRVAAAYEVLADPQRRAAYDRDRRFASVPGSTAGRGRRPGATGPVTIPVQHRRGDYLRDRRPDDRRTASRPRRGRDLRVERTIPFERAVLGGTITVQVPGASSRSAGGSGSGSGAAPASASGPAPGPGSMRGSRDGPGSVGGSGSGSGAAPVEVQLPAGIRDGQIVRVPGAGAPSTTGGAPGDLEVVLRVQPHPRFGRRGDDLTLTVPVTYPEAVLGAGVPVPLPDGDHVTVRIPAGTRSGQVLRVRGRGVPTGTGRGDLLVTVEIAVPEHVSDAERRALDMLARTTDVGPRDEPFWRR